MVGSAMQASKLKEFSRYAMLPALGIALGILSLEVRGTHFAKVFPYYHSFVSLFAMITL